VRLLSKVDGVLAFVAIVAIAGVLAANGTGVAAIVGREGVLRLFLLLDLVDLA
jgi:hypothetical protein